MTAIAFTATEYTPVVLGNGRKMVVTDLVPSNTGVEVGTYTVKGLKSVSDILFFVSDPGSTARTYVVTVSGKIVSVTPSDDASGAVLKIIAYGE